MKSMKFFIVRAIVIVVLIFMVSAGFCAEGKGGFSKALGSGSDIDATADSLQFIGTNVVAKGDVFIRYQDFIVKADKAIVNISTKDVEAVGNVRLIRRSQYTENITLKEYREYRKLADKRVRIDGYAVNSVGEQFLKVTIYENSSFYRGHKIVGNLTSGALEFQDFEGRINEYYCKGKYAKRSPGGEMEITDAKLTSCEYVLDNQEHYSITAGKIKIYPYERVLPYGGKKGPVSIAKQNTDIGESSIFAYNCTLRLGSLPVMWLPMMYKPRDKHLHWFQFQAGESTDFGYFLKLSKTFDLFDYPNTTTKLMLDIFTERGIAIGNETKVSTEKTYTEFFVYGLRDKNPYGGSSDSKKVGDLRSETDRITIPHNRYDLRLSHLNHITPRMDFRGHIEKISDMNFLKDYFEDRYNADPQPVTFASLEYQFDRFSAALYVRPRINDFETVVERLPEFRLDFPRQELFSNIYYQGETTADYFRMRWRNYDNPRITENYIDPSNYETFRFDSLHMFYYPFKLDWLNIIPRAGIRMTLYSNSTAEGISTEQWGSIFYVDRLDGHPIGDVPPMQESNKWKCRIAGEIGLQMNTKIYRSWQNIKNAFWQLDGLRHVAVPYINYTYIPKPTVDRKNLFYFDDVDRIDEQNFVRFGLKNRLQTRRGEYGNERIYNWLTLENYIDYYFQKQSGFKNLGNLGTILKFNPTPDLTFSSELLLDLAQNSKHDVDTYRVGTNVGRPGLNWKFIDRWNVDIQYQILEDLKFFVGYEYRDAYTQPSAYSMGTTLTEIDTGSGFFNGYYGRNQTVRWGLEFPIPIDDKTRGSCEMRYDFEVGYIREMKAKIVRRMHCWELALEVGQEIDRESVDFSKRYKQSVMFTLNLVALPSIAIGHSQKNY